MPQATDFRVSFGDESQAAETDLAAESGSEYFNPRWREQHAWSWMRKHRVTEKDIKTAFDQEKNHQFYVQVTEQNIEQFGCVMGAVVGYSAFQLGRRRLNPGRNLLFSAVGGYAGYQYGRLAAHVKHRNSWFATDYNSVETTVLATNFLQTSRRADTLEGSIRRLLHRDRFPLDQDAAQGSSNEPEKQVEELQKEAEGVVERLGLLEQALEKSLELNVDNLCGMFTHSTRLSNVTEEEVSAVIGAFARQVDPGPHREQICEYVLPRMKNIWMGRSLLQSVLQELWFDYCNFVTWPAGLFLIWRGLPLSLAFGLAVIPAGLTSVWQNYSRLSFLFKEDEEPVMYYTDLGEKVTSVSCDVAHKLEAVLLRARFTLLQERFPERPWRENWRAARGMDLKAISEKTDLDYPASQEELGPPEEI